MLEVQSPDMQIPLPVHPALVFPRCHPYTENLYVPAADGQEFGPLQKGIDLSNISRYARE